MKKYISACAIEHIFFVGYSGFVLLGLCVVIIIIIIIIIILLLLLLVVVVVVVVL